jgi:hypothetical protein
MKQDLNSGIEELDASLLQYVSGGAYFWDDLAITTNELLRRDDRTDPEGGIKP